MLFDVLVPACVDDLAGYGDGEDDELDLHVSDVIGKHGDKLRKL